MKIVSLVAVVVLGTAIGSGLGVAVYPTVKGYADRFFETQDFKDMRAAMLENGTPKHIVESTEFVDVQPVRGISDSMGFEDTAYCGTLKRGDRTAKFGAYRQEGRMYLVSPKQFMSGYHAICSPNTDVGRAERAAFNLVNALQTE